MKKIINTLICFLLVTVGFTSLSQAVVLVEYNFDIDGSASVPAGVSGNVSATDWTAPGPLGDRALNISEFGAGAIVWSPDLNLDNSANDTYYEFTISALNSGEFFDLENLSFTEQKGNNTHSPQSFSIEVNGALIPLTGGGASSLETSEKNFPTTYTFDLSAFQGLETVAIKIYAYDNTGSQNLEWFVDSVQLTGSVVPEPHEYAIVASILLIGFVGIRRWKLSNRTA